MAPYNYMDIKRFYKLLGHEDFGLTELRVIHPKKGLLGIGFFDSKEAFVKACLKWNGKGNIYVGRNSRSYILKDNIINLNVISQNQWTGGKSKDIKWVTMFNLDIDPIRPKGLASTHQEFQAAIKTGQKITQSYPTSVLYSTGNGVGVLFPVKPYRIHNNHRLLALKTKAWEERFRLQVESSSNLKLDSMFDLARIIKVAGTYSIKGNNSVERPFRVSRILVDRRYPKALKEVLNIEIEPDSSPFSHTDIDFTHIPSELPSKFITILQKSKKLKNTWEGNRPELKDQSRSGYDLALADLLAVYGFSEHEMVCILRNAPCGKNRNASKAYLNLTIRKAKQFTANKI